MFMEGVVSNENVFADLMGADMEAASIVVGGEKPSSNEERSRSGNPILEMMYQVRRRSVRLAAPSLFSEAAARVTKVLAGIFRRGMDIVIKALTIAVYKFAIEFCAIGIRSLIDSMASQKIGTTGIDTPGVYYNPGAPVSTQGASQQPGYNQARVDNSSPFGNVFGNNSMPW